MFLKGCDLELNRKYKLLFRDTFLFALGSLGSKLILFFLVPLYTNVLSKAEYGTADLISSFSQLVIPFSAVVINEAVIRFGMKTKVKKENVLLSSFWVLLCSFFSAGIICYSISYYELISDWWIYLYIITVLSNVSEVEKAYLKVKDKNKILAIVSILQTAVLAISNILFLTVNKMGIKGYLLSTIVAYAFCSTFTFFAAEILSDIRKAQFDRDLTIKMIKYSSPLILSNVSWWVIHSSDRIMIERMINASDLGIYTTAAKIPSLINVIIGIFNQAWCLSSIREIESSDDNSYYKLVFETFSTFLFAAAIFFTSIIKPFMSIYVGNEFKSAWIYVPLLLSSAVFYSISAFIGSLYAAIQKSQNNMWTMILCAVINVLVNYFFIIRIGIWGAIIGTISAYFVIAIIRIIDIKRYIVLSINWIRYSLNIIIMLVQALLISLKWNVLIISIVSIICFTINNIQIIKQAGIIIRKLRKK